MGSRTVAKASAKGARPALLPRPRFERFSLQRVPSSLVSSNVSGEARAIASRLRPLAGPSPLRPRTRSRPSTRSPFHGLGSHARSSVSALRRSGREDPCLGARHPGRGVRTARECPGSLRIPAPPPVRSRRPTRRSRSPAGTHPNRYRHRYGSRHRLSSPKSACLARSPGIGNRQVQQARDALELYCTKFRGIALEPRAFTPAYRHGASPASPSCPAGDAARTASEKTSVNIQNTATEYIGPAVSFKAAGTLNAQRSTLL